MNSARFILRSLVFYRRTNAGIALGAALGSVVFAGALMVGDSVRFSLMRITQARLGKADFVLTTDRHLFEADLAARINTGDPPPASILLLNGVATWPEDNRRINNVQIVGVEDGFWDYAPVPAARPVLEAGASLVNRAFAEHMGMDEFSGDVVLQIHRPGALPTDMTLAARAADTWSRRVRVDGVLETDAFGQFSLRATQVSPPTVFVPRAWLGRQLGVADRANVVLLRTAESAAAPLALPDRIASAWQLADAGLTVRALPDGTAEVQSDRVFLPAVIVAAARRVDAGVQPVTAYLVNRIAAGGQTVPYSFAAAPGPPRVPHTLADDEVLINDWLAEDLGIGLNAPVTVYWYTVDAGIRLAERSETFRVAGILPAGTVAPLDRSLVPHITGLTDADHCRDWDPGIPIDLSLIRPRDEAYWQAYGPAPKLYLSTATADRLWRNRFGVCTALRFTTAAGDAATVAAQLRAELDWRDIGIRLIPAKHEGLAAAREAVDFGTLFMGLSFFLMASAILLTALLFGIHVDGRAAEAGALLALGVPPRTLWKLRLSEGGLLVVAGGALGGGMLAIGYNGLILHALRTVWRAAVGTAALQMHIRPSAAIGGSLTIILTALAALALTVRRQQSGTMLRMIQGAVGPDRGQAYSTGRRAITSGLLGIVLALTLPVVWPTGDGRASAGVFFTAGAVLLVSFLTLCKAALQAFQSHRQPRLLTPSTLLLKGISLRPGRSLACVALMALGIFLVVAVAANRRGAGHQPEDPSSGTGGYALWGQTALPLTHELESPVGRIRAGIPPELAHAIHVTPVRFLDGDDASCLNLNRVTQPPLLGVDFQMLDRRGAFTFTHVHGAHDPDRPWLVLDNDPGPDLVPAVADRADILWGLGKAMGDTLTYADENGRTIRLKLVGALERSVLQGHVVIAERHLATHFPSRSATRVVLVDAPVTRADEALAGLSARLSDLGFEGQSTVRRLEAFTRVENTYLSIFMILGALGILVGSAGMGIVAARTILERRPELALLRAVGFSRQRIRVLIFREHALLALVGILGGSLAAMPTVISTQRAIDGGGTVAWRGTVVTIIAVQAAVLLWIWLGEIVALRGRLTDALRNE